MGSLKRVVILSIVLIASACTTQTGFQFPLNKYGSEPDTQEDSSQAAIISTEEMQNGAMSDQVTASATLDTLSLYAEIVGMSTKKREKKIKDVVNSYQKDKAAESQLKMAVAVLASESLTVKKQRQVQSYLKSAKNALKQQKTPPEGLAPLMTMVENLVETKAKATEEQQQLSRQLTESKGEVARLQQQINALKSIEKSIHERELSIEKRE